MIKNFPKDDKYQIILADPPWSYHLRVNDVTHRNRIDYESMTNQDILDLPIAEISQPDSYLFLWATKDHLQLALECVERWGYTYKNTFVWLKVSKAGTPHIGTGHWGRNCVEFLILAAMPKAKNFTALGITNQPTIIQAPRGKHSQKPEESFIMIERVVSALHEPKCLELFARSHRSGWTSWGDQLPPSAEAV